MPGIGSWQAYYARPSQDNRFDADSWGKPSRTHTFTGRLAQTSLDQAASTELTIPLTLPTAPPERTSIQMWQQLEVLLSQAQYQQIPIISALLAETLRKQPDPDVYQRIINMLMQRDVPMEVKAILLDLLAETATTEALEQLLDLAALGQEADSSLSMLVLQAIARIGDSRWDGLFHEELSPILETAWSDPSNTDPAFLAAIGKAIATVGAPQGVEQLLQTVSGSNANKNTETTHRIKQEVAFKAIPQVRNPAAVDVLATRLEQEPLGTAAFEVSGTALAKIGNPIATQKIAHWAKGAPTEGARNLKDWLANVHDEGSLASLSAIAQTEFKSPAIGAVMAQVAANTQPKTASPTHTLAGHGIAHLQQGMKINK
ncbi:MAG: hypothetical protein PHU14_10800 [Methylovulum sp.]|nr:hypothetical protein [Methylovulum sp.]